MECEECGSTTVVRPSGFRSCPCCGKLAIAPAVVKSEEAGRLAPTESGEFTLEVPDYSDVMVGWRAWGVAPTSPGVLLSVTRRDSAGNPWYWGPREPMQAMCPKDPLRAHGKDHGVPGEGCTCGLYSAKTQKHLMGMGYRKYDAERTGQFRVMGEVSLWGKIVEGTQGWRAEFGYPRNLLVPFEAYALVAPLKDAYGVPVELANILK